MGERESLPFFGRPKPANTLPKALPQPAVGALLEAVATTHHSGEPTGLSATWR